MLSQVCKNSTAQPSRLALQKRWDSPASRGRAFGRQMASIAWQAGDGRDTALQSCQVPAIVVHGMEDKLIPMEAGLHTARCLGGENCRKVVLVPGCAHSMDDKLARHIVDAVVENCRFADAQQEEKQQQQQQRQRGHTRSSMASRL